MDRVMTRPPTSVAPLPALRPGWLVMFFYRCRPQWFAPKRICAWCEKVIAAGGFFSRGKLSHGVCADCSSEAMEQVHAARRLRELGLALFFFAAILALSSCDKPAAANAADRVYRPQRHEAVAVPTPAIAGMEVVQ